MKISFKKLKHLYLIYGFLNVLLIVAIIVSAIYMYRKQSMLFSLESTLGNELMNLTEYKSTSFDYAFKTGNGDKFYIESADNEQNEFIKLINNSKLQINKIEKNIMIDNIHFQERMNGVKSDYEILISENNLLLDYLREIGDYEHGELLNLKNAASDLRMKLKMSTSYNQTNEDLDQSVFLIELLIRNRDVILLKEIESKMLKMRDALVISDSSYNNYLIVRLSDSFQNFENNYKLLTKTILEIGLSEQSGLMKVMDDRYSKAKLRLKESLQIIQGEKKNVELNAILVLFILFLIVVALNFASAVFFVQFSGNFTSTLNEHFKGLNKGEFVKIDRNKVPEEVYGLIEGLELFTKKILNSGKSFNIISSGNMEIDLEKNNYLDLFYQSIIRIKQKIELLDKQLINERRIQAEIQWIKQGMDRLTDVMRQEFDNPLLHSNKIIYSLIEYLDIPMGAIYHYKDEEGSKYLEIAASFAYGKEKLLYRKISVGEGIVGSSAAEKKTLNLTNVPDSYFNVISGFSEIKPKNILVSPIKLNEEIYGVIELASLSTFKDEEIRFVEEVCKAIAYSFAISKVYMDTLYLFEGANLEIAQLKSENESILLDNDELKKINKELKLQGFDNEYIIDRLNEFAIIINLDLDGNILDVNTKFEQFFKSDKKKYMHSNYREYMMEVNSDIDFEIIWKNLRAGIKHELNQKVIITNQEYWLNQHFFPMKDQKGKIKGIRILAFEINNKTTIENTQLQEK